MIVIDAGNVPDGAGLSRQGHFHLRHPGKPPAVIASKSDAMHHSGVGQNGKIVLRLPFDHRYDLSEDDEDKIA